MHIILVSDRLPTAKTITLTLKHLVLGLSVFGLLVLSLAGLFSYVTVRHAAEIRLPFLQDLVMDLRARKVYETQSFLRENLNSMAVRLGKMQAQLTRLDSLGERLAKVAGLKPHEIKLVEQPAAQGGPLITPDPTMSQKELQAQLDQLYRELDTRGDYLGVLESELLVSRIRKNLLPTTLPVDAMWNSSSFGWRIDPFTGQRAMHEGVDFMADVGTPIVAAASGVVVLAEKHASYGNLIEIDHGNGLTTRYAHASKLFVAQGTVVKRGQKVAAVGTTGRSTGPHLHFEVRVNGAPQNPNRFLQAAKEQADRLVSR